MKKNIKSIIVILQYFGDSTLSIFNSADEAVEYAILHLKPSDKGLFDGDQFEFVK